MPSTTLHKYHEEIAENGFTIIRQFLTAEEIAQYRKASEDLIKYTREGKWPHARTRGKQFPPWPKDFTPDIWGITGLLHPELGELSKPFHDFYASDKILAVAGDILKTDKYGLSMELLNMLINPLTDFELDWHRDTIKPEVSEEEEAELLLKDQYDGAQFNLALLEDNCLIVVPKSHNRIRTPEERKKTTNDNRKEFIQGQITVELAPGDLVFYNNNILHRAAYSSKNLRITLHGSYGRVNHGDSRAKGILQHGIADWLPDLKSDNENLNLLKEKLIALTKKFENVQLGYALEG
ncbi:hypothetical protein PACTADRAFT_50397 [Pachysolen tannophilus NRRL Y-2460]|uniref:Phytanoyl-CoA dioxygenase n=1 Tax=Pachysolen tannophilus NRRL Y-2460 TaxID=669874 RepID=A0A1E4TVB7_PACTA|nr:hypothetical protein PACTADRAFT_50397 [Pachysolen tannophilus NRRL Y-2460]